jgi:hypothetical protein
MSDNMDNSTNEISWVGFFAEKWLLGLGLLLILINIVAFFGINISPNTLLFYFNMRYWSVYTSVIIWLTVIWLASESTDFMEDYLSFVRVSTAIGTLLILFFMAQDSFKVVGASPSEYRLLTNIVIVLSICLIVRSLFLFYDYRYNGEASIDTEEAKWFWGLSCFFLATVIIIGIMSIIPVSVPMHKGVGESTTVPLLTSCQHGLRELIRGGEGSMALRVFGCLVIAALVAFAYVLGKWLFVFLARMKGE